MFGSFHCDEPDFFVRSMRDDPPVQFGVLRKALSVSEIFRDMFDCCDSGFAMSMTADDNDQTLDLDETSDVMNILLGLLHTPPPPPERIQQTNVEKKEPIHHSRFEPGSVIPFPLLPRMLQLADKYALSENLTRSLLAHVSAHISAYPLEVYGFAAERGLLSLAVDASKYLLHPPLSSYSMRDIKDIPSPEAWHKLVLLHDVRIRGLREILLGEEIFPHGYGICSSHKDRAVSLWTQRKMDIVLKIEAGTDVAAEMGDLEHQFSSCRTCHNACSAAVKMLAYKCQRLPKSIKNIDDSETGGGWLTSVLSRIVIAGR